MAEHFPHSLLIELMNAKYDKDLPKAYDCIYRLIIYDDGKLLASLFQAPDMQELLSEIIGHYIAWEEYEKCAEIRKFVLYINQKRETL